MALTPASPGVEYIGNARDSFDQMVAMYEASWYQATSAVTQASGTLGGKALEHANDQVRKAFDDMHRALTLYAGALYELQRYIDSGGA